MCYAPPVGRELQMIVVLGVYVTTADSLSALGELGHEELERSGWLNNNHLRGSTPVPITRSQLRQVETRLVGAPKIGEWRPQPAKLRHVHVLGDAFLHPHFADW